MAEGNKLSFTGKIEALSNQRSGEGKNGTWKSIDLIVKETIGDYPQSAAFTAGTKKYDEAIACRIGEEVTIHFNLKTNFYKERYYTSLEIWKIEKVASGVEQQNNSQQSNNQQVETDLPF